MLIKFYLEYAFNVRIGVKRVRERFLFYLKKKKKKKKGDQYSSINSLNVMSLKYKTIG